MKTLKLESDESILLSRFNSRNIAALTKVYDICYRDMVYFTGLLLKDLQIEACDLFHDVLLKLWEKRELRFDSIKSLKSYLYVAIRNTIYNHITREKCADRYNMACANQEVDYFSDVAESEILSLLYESIELMPQEMAKIFTLMIEGYDVKDISEKLGRSQSYIYTKKSAGIVFLKQKIKKNNSFIMLLINSL